MHRATRGLRRLARPTSITVSLAALAVAGLGLSAGPAAAGGDHDDDGPSVVLPLTDNTVNRLTAGANTIRALGAAEKDNEDGTVYLSLPVRDADHDSHDDRGAGGDHGDDGVVKLAGAIEYAGAGPDVRWSGLRVDLDTGRISADTGAGRTQVLVIDHGDHGDDDHGDDHGYGHHRGGGGYDATVTLTSAGAASLNAAADGSPFAAGDVFAEDGSGC